MPGASGKGTRLRRPGRTLPEAAPFTEEQWRRRWDARRLFLTADGESGAPYGNYTITVDPDSGAVSIVLPEPLRHLANAPRGRYTLACTVQFHHRREAWLDRASANRAVRYDITFDPDRGRWYLDASWASETAVLPGPQEIQALGERLLGIDLTDRPPPETAGCARPSPT
ncbi:hypothetical protein ACX6XY_18310 [Streptomyces sp. O3]